MSVLPSDVRVWRQEEGRNLSSRQLLDLFHAEPRGFETGATFSDSRSSRGNVVRGGKLKSAGFITRRLRVRVPSDAPNLGGLS